MFCEIVCPSLTVLNQSNLKIDEIHILKMKGFNKYSLHWSWTQAFFLSPEVPILCVPATEIKGQTFTLKWK